MLNIGVTRKSLVDNTTFILLLSAVLVSILIHLLHIITHFPFFDESIQTRYLWLMANGFRANVDFFCLYPSLGFFLTLPYFKLFPESTFVLLALRLFSALFIALIGVIFYFHGKKISNHWVFALLTFLLISTDQSIGVFFSEYSIDHIAAFTAIWAMTLIMSKPRIDKLALCAALCVTSLFIMPKYHFPLNLGLLGYLFVCYSDSKKVLKIFSGLFAGVVAALLLISAVFIFNSGSFSDNFKYAYLFNLKLSTVMSEKIPDSSLFSRVFFHVLFFLRHHPLLSGLFTLGILGWSRRTVTMWRKPDHYVWGGGGVLLGCLMATASTSMYTEQYLAPTLLCLALFVPFAFTFISSTVAIRLTKLVAAVVVFCMLLVRLDRVADEFNLTPLDARADTAIERKLLEEVRMVPSGVNILKEYDELLDIVPRNEAVVAAWPYHPLFRRDLTFQIYDDLPSISFGFKNDDPLVQSFSAATFKEALEKSPPGLIILQGMDEFYPRGWDKVAQEFISRNGNLYESYSAKLIKGYVRRDLLGQRGGQVTQY